MFENIKDINDLQAVVLGINVKDYGDFKRKVVLYVNRYAEEHSLNADQKKIFAGIVDKIQYNYSSDIEKARRWTIDQLSHV